MNCSDPVCISLMTCKWDCEISNVYCEATYYPTPERKEITTDKPVTLEQNKTQVNRVRPRGEYYGRVNKGRQEG